MITGVEDEGEIMTEERKEICDGTPLMATHAYTKNQESPAPVLTAAIIHANTANY